MATLTLETFGTCSPTTYADIRNAISLLESAVGHSRFEWRDCLTISPSGPALAPANRSPSPASEKAKATSDTCGQNSHASSTSAALQLSLENRLRARMAAFGSPEYALTWKQWPMPSGPPICALRASARRTSVNGSTGWPTPQHREGGGGEYADPAKALARMQSGHQVNLQDVARAVGWATPTGGKVMPSMSGQHEDGRKVNVSLKGQIGVVAGWATPRALSFMDSHQPGMNGAMKQWLDNGAIHGSPAPMAKGVALNPAFPCWLMGFPQEWQNCAASETPSSRKSRRNS